MSRSGDCGRGAGSVTLQERITQAHARPFAGAVDVFYRAGRPTSLCTHFRAPFAQFATVDAGLRACGLNGSVTVTPDGREITWTISEPLDS